MGYGSRCDLDLGMQEVILIAAHLCIQERDAAAAHSSSCFSRSRRRQLLMVMLRLCLGTACSIASQQLVIINRVPIRTNGLRAGGSGCD